MVKLPYISNKCMVAKIFVYLCDWLCACVSGVTYLWGSLRFDVRRYTARWRPLYTSLMHCVFTDCQIDKCSQNTCLNRKIQKFNGYYTILHHFFFLINKIYTPNSLWWTSRAHPFTCMTGVPNSKAPPLFTWFPKPSLSYMYLST